MTHQRKRALCWLYAGLMTAAVMVFVLLGTDMHYAVNDDAGILRAFLGYESGEPASFHIYIHGILAWPLWALSTLFPGLPWFSYAQLFMLALSCTVIAKSIMQAILHNVPCESVDRLVAGGVGKHPVGTCRNLCDEVGISRCGKFLRSGSCNFGVHYKSVRRRTVHCLFVAVDGDRGTVCSVAVHGGSSADAHISPSECVGNVFREIVYHAGSHGDRYCIQTAQVCLQLLYIFPLGIQIFIHEYERLFLLYRSPSQ